MTNKAKEILNIIYKNIGKPVDKEPPIPKPKRCQTVSSEENYNKCVYLKCVGVDSSNRITIPYEVREKTHIKKGDKVLISCTDNNTVIIRKKPK